MRITAIVTGRGREPGNVPPPTPPETDAGGLATTPPLQVAMERRRTALLADCPELVGTNGAVRDADPRSAIEWLLDRLRESGADLGAAWADLQLICLGHSTVDANVFHAPVARIKHELGARRALPFAVGQCQSLAFFHGLQLLSAWVARSGGSAAASALLGTVEKRRAPLIPHVSRRIPISDGVGAALLRFDAGCGLELKALDVAAPPLISEAEGFQCVIDQGDAGHARTLANRLWQSLQATPNALCVGPNLRGRLHAQVQSELTLLSRGAALSVEPGEHFFMASDPLVALEHGNAINRDRLPLLLWTIDDRLSVAAAMFTGQLAQRSNS
jgi:hypothetical protein